MYTTFVLLVEDMYKFVYLCDFFIFFDYFFYSIGNIIFIDAWMSNTIF